MDSKDLILSKVHKLMAAYRDGLLGGERLEECNTSNRGFMPDSINLQTEKGAWIIKMPEHENPGVVGIDINDHMAIIVLTFD